jgi:hypothetical protein
MARYGQAGQKWAGMLIRILWQDVFILGTNYLGQPNAGVSNQKNNANLKPEFTQEFEAGYATGFL